MALCASAISDEGMSAQSYFLPFLTYPGDGTTGPVVRIKTDSRLLIIKCNYKNEWKGYTYYFLGQQNKWSLLLKEPFAERRAATMGIGKDERMMRVAEAFCRDFSTVDSQKSGAELWGQAT
jgi:hypothetical protein